MKGTSDDKIEIFKKKYQEGPNLWNHLVWFWVEFKSKWYHLFVLLRMDDNEDYDDI